jgi:hypothetical protein
VVKEKLPKRESPAKEARKDWKYVQLLDQIDVSQEHTTAAVPLQLEGIESIAAGRQHNKRVSWARKNSNLLQRVSKAMNKQGRYKNQAVKLCKAE